MRRKVRQMQGLGDAIEAVTEATGIKSVVEKVVGKNCGCGKRRDKLNEMVPFQKEASDGVQPDEA